MHLGDFVIDELAARRWLSGVLGRGELPSRDPDGDPRPALARLLVAAQARSGPAVTPPGAQIALEFPPTPDLRSYRFVVDVASPNGTTLRLCSRLLPPTGDPGSESRDRVETAYRFLRHAVAQANDLLRSVEEFTVPYLQQVIDELQRNVVEGQGPTSICGCGWPVTYYEDCWMHVFNPELTGTDDHDANGPDRLLHAVPEPADTGHP